jgi:hypothetical protein
MKRTTGSRRVLCRARRPAGPIDGKNGRYLPESTPVRRLLFATTSSNEGNPLSDMSEWDCYADLFGEGGAALSDAAWIARANDSLPPNLSALNARFVTGSRTERFLQVSCRPRSGVLHLLQPQRWMCRRNARSSSGAVRHVRDEPRCPTLTMTANYMRAGKGSEFVATARLLTVTSAAAVLGAEPTDEREGRIASVSVVVQLVKDTTEQR